MTVITSVLIIYVSMFQNINLTNCFEKSYLLSFEVLTLLRIVVHRRCLLQLSCGRSRRKLIEIYF